MSRCLSCDYIVGHSPNCPIPRGKTTEMGKLRAEVGKLREELDVANEAVQRTQSTSAYDEGHRHGSAVAAGLKAEVGRLNRTLSDYWERLQIADERAASALKARDEATARAESAEKARDEALARVENLRASHDFPRIQDVVALDEAARLLRDWRKWYRTPAQEGGAHQRAGIDSETGAFLAKLDAPPEESRREEILTGWGGDALLPSSALATEEPRYDGKMWPEPSGREAPERCQVRFDKDPCVLLIDHEQHRTATGWSWYANRPAEANEKINAAHAESAALREALEKALEDGKTPEQRLSDALASGESPEVIRNRQYYALVDAVHAALSSTASADYAKRVQGLVDALEMAEEGFRLNGPEGYAIEMRAALRAFKGES